MQPKFNSVNFKTFFMSLFAVKVEKPNKRFFFYLFFNACLIIFTNTTKLITYLGSLDVWIIILSCRKVENRRPRIIRQGHVERLFLLRIDFSVFFFISLLTTNHQSCDVFMAERHLRLFSTLSPSLGQGEVFDHVTKLCLEFFVRQKNIPVFSTIASHAKIALRNV